MINIALLYYLIFLHDFAGRLLLLQFINGFEFLPEKHKITLTNEIHQVIACSEHIKQLWIFMHALLIVYPDTSDLVYIYTRKNVYIFLTGINENFFVLFN